MSRMKQVSAILLMVTFWLVACNVAADPARERLPYDELKSANGAPIVTFDGMTSGFGIGIGASAQSEHAFPPPAPGPDFYKIRISSLHLGSGTATTISIKDAVSGKPLGQWTQDDILSQSAILSDPLPSNRGIYMQVSPETQLDLRFSVSVLVPRYSLNTIEAQGIGGGMTFFNDLLQRDKLLSQSVAKLIIGSDGTICTGFLVTGDLMLTAFHCLAEHSAAFKRSRNATSILCDDVRAQFDFHTIHDTGRVPFAVCRRVLAYGDYAHDEVTKENGDFALLKFNAADITLSDPGHPPRPHLTIKQLPPSPTAMVEIFQHPLGFPLQASYCTVDLGVSSSQASYNCASYEGSSGAPVIDWTTGNVIVLHTTGGAQDFDPQPCASPTAPACVQSANHGTPIQTIWPKLSSVLD